MSKTIYSYLYELSNTGKIHDSKVTICRACYTGYLLYVEEFLKYLKINDKGEIIYDKIIAKILETHKKINDLIESLNKKTDYKFKEIFESRNNYCNEKTCGICEPGAIVYQVIILKNI